MYVDMYTSYCALPQDVWCHSCTGEPAETSGDEGADGSTGCSQKPVIWTGQRREQNGNSRSECKLA